jgi:phosphate uptake regulator
METQFFPTDGQQLKAYWKRPGGKFGTLAGVGLLVTAGYYVLPILTSVVWNTFNFGMALAALGIFLYAVTHRKLRLGLFYFYEILMKKLVGVVIELDPFIVAEDYIDDMMDEREKLYKQATDVDTQKEKIHLKIKEKEVEISKLMSKAHAAKERGMMQELGNTTRQIGRLKEYILQLTPIHENLTRIGDYLTNIHKNSAYLIEDARNELELKKDLFKSVTSGNRALTSALKIFKGDPEKKLLVEQSMEFLKEDIASKLANMKKAISYSSDFMKSIDLDNATYEKEGLRMLDQFNIDNAFTLSRPELRKSPSNADYGELLK